MDLAPVSVEDPTQHTRLLPAAALCTQTLTIHSSIHAMKAVSAGFPLWTTSTYLAQVLTGPKTCFGPVPPSTCPTFAADQCLRWSAPAGLLAPSWSNTRSLHGFPLHCCMLLHGVLCGLLLQASAAWWSCILSISSDASKAFPDVGCRAVWGIHLGRQCHWGSATP